MADLPTSKSKEFTLLHLSALFAVMALLLGAVIPPTRVMPFLKLQQDADICAYQLFEIRVAMDLYAENYGSRCPVDSASPTLVGSLQLLSNVEISARFLFCPGDQRPNARPETDFSKLTTDNISYSYVPNLIWQGSNTPSIVLLDRIDMPGKGGQWSREGNHRFLGGNVLFTDGHIESFDKLPAALKDKVGKTIVLSP